MKKAIYRAYGNPEVIKVIEVDKPIPKSNEILVKIKASAVTRADTLMRKGSPKFGRLFIGLFKPKRESIGTGFSGIIESIGSQVEQFKINDEVFGEILFGTSANAEYVCIPEDSIISIKPTNVTHQEAAPICDGFLTSFSFLKAIGNLKPGQHILINGASGSLGSAAVQLAKLLGAKVTAVCSASNIDLVKSLGADNVLDYNKIDFTKANDFYDIIYDAVGKTSYNKCKKVLCFNGIYMSPVLSGSLLWYTIISPKKAKFSATGIRKKEDLKQLLFELAVYFKQGKLKTIIDRTYSLDKIVEAHRYVESGHKKGNISIIN